MHSFVRHKKVGYQKETQHFYNSCIEILKANKNKVYKYSGLQEWSRIVIITFIEQINQSEY